MSGGAKQRYVYANDPSKVLTLNVSDSRSGWRDDKIPEMLGNRMWHGCTLANIDDEVSNLVHHMSTTDPESTNPDFFSKNLLPFFSRVASRKETQSGCLFSFKIATI